MVQVLDKKDIPPALLTLDFLFKEVPDTMWEVPKFWVSGGSLQSLITKSKVNDVDIFGPNPTAIVDWLMFRGYEVTYSDTLITNFRGGKYKLQVIMKYPHETPEVACEMFDFTVVSASYDGEKLYCHDRFFMDIAQKRLVINNNHRPLSTFDRSYKYCAKGFELCPVAKKIIAEDINNMSVDWENPDENTLTYYPNGSAKFMGID